MDREYMLDELREMDVLPTFSGTVKGVTNAIEDPMSSATDLVKSTGASMAGEVLRAADTVYFGTRNFRNTASENREYTVAMSLGNMFAKRINMGDNFSSFDEFINEYRDFAYFMEDPGIKLMPTEEVTFFERIFMLSERAKSFLKRC